MSPANYSNSQGMRRRPVPFSMILTTVVIAAILFSLLSYYIRNQVQSEYETLLLEHVRSGKQCGLYIQEPAPALPSIGPVAADCDDRCQLLAARNYTRALRNHIDLIHHNEDVSFRRHVESCGL